MVPPPTSGQAVAQAWVTGATNLAMLLPASQAFRLGLYHEGTMGVMTMLTSSAYHVCQSLDWKLLGFNEGRWHHMDNVFSIASLMAIVLGFAQVPRGSPLREVLNAGSVSLAIVAQLMSPWDVRFTVGPLAAAIMVMLASITWRGRLPKLDLRAGRNAFGLFAGAVLCFVKGLDDRRDWLRLWHGGWHLMVAGFSYYALCAQHPRGAAGVAPCKVDVDTHEA